MFDKIEIFSVEYVIKSSFEPVVHSTYGKPDNAVKERKVKLK